MRHTKILWKISVLDVNLKQNSTEDFSKYDFFCSLHKENVLSRWQRAHRETTSFVSVFGITRVVIREGQ